MYKIILCAVILCLAFSCTENGTATRNTPIQKNASLQFFTHSYIELDKIERISKFRSGIGHDYSDDFEECRSMKHYFQPFDSVDWSQVKIFAPVSGKIIRVEDEGRGMQIQIEPSNLSNFTVIIFHVNLIKLLNVGDIVSSGQLLGTHFSNETYSDIAISSYNFNKYRLISYFDFLPDSLFSQYIERNVNTRFDLIISKEARDADSLNCTGEKFGTEGNLENWVNLK